MDLTGYELETLRDDGEFLLHRARQPDNPVPVLTLVATRSPLIKRLEHEYALADDLDPSWAARPLALVRHNGSATLVLDDNWPSRRTAESLGARVTGNFVTYRRDF